MSGSLISGYHLIHITVTTKYFKKKFMCLAGMQLIMLRVEYYNEISTKNCRLIDMKPSARMSAPQNIIS